MRMKTLLALLVLVAVVACRSNPTLEASAGGASQASEASRSSGGKFDFYLLNLSWSPEYCYSHPSAGECAAHSSFVLHGLWPQNNSGSYPENCSNAPGPSDPAAYKDIYPETGLLEHEWRAHGTCSGLSADEFFTKARTAFQSISIPYVLRSLSSQATMSPDEIVSLFTASNVGMPRASVAVSCGKNYLTAVEICLDKTSLRTIACPNVRTCRAGTVRIPPP